MSASSISNINRVLDHNSCITLWILRLLLDCSRRHFTIVNWDNKKLMPNTFALLVCMCIWVCVCAGPSVMSNQQSHRSCFSSWVSVEAVLWLKHHGRYGKHVFSWSTLMFLPQESVLDAFCPIRRKTSWNKKALLARPLVRVKGHKRTSCASKCVAVMLMMVFQVVHTFELPAVTGREIICCTPLQGHLCTQCIRLWS